MIYVVLRALAGVALRWYYRDVRVLGLERVPRTGPLLVAPNHPNALVDALLVGGALPRRLLITAKATLFTNPLGARVLRGLGVLPLRRASDERARRAGGGAPDPSRNEETFRAVLDALAAGGAVLMFPEGKSWDEPYLAPLRTGAARIALQARDEGGVRGLAILPVGLVFEQKESPRTRVLVEIGEPIHLDAWRAPAAGSAVASLTADLTARLHAVTLNHPSIDAAIRERDLAALFAVLRDDLRAVSDDPPLDHEVALARRIAEARTLLDAAADVPPTTVERVGDLLRRADDFDAEVRRHRLAVEDVRISPRTLPGARFAMREGLFFALGAPVALWGRAHHAIPFALARAIGRGGASQADPAMRTIVAALVVTIAWYLLLGVVAFRLSGSPLGTTLYLLSLPLAEDFALRYQERLGRARRRMHAYFTFRRDPALQARLRGELESLREESVVLERELLGRG